MEGKLLSILACIIIIIISTILTGTEDIYHMAAIPLVLTKLPHHTLEVISANMLSDGCIRYPNFKRDGKASGNARYEMTMAAQVKDYLQHLFDTVYGQFSSTGLTG